MTSTSSRYQAWASDPATVIMPYVPPPVTTLPPTVTITEMACDDCGANVLGRNFEKHDRWHAALDALMEKYVE